MTTPLDEKALKAAAEAVAGSLSGYVIADCEAIIRAYLSTVALPDELEVAGWVMGSSFTTDPLMADYWGKTAKAVTGSDQAHSTIAALSAKVDEWELAATVANEEAGAQKQRASELEAQVQRLTEEKEALRVALGNMRCPRPCNHRPDEFDAKDCVSAGECGCGAAILTQENADG